MSILNLVASSIVVCIITICVKNIRKDVGQLITVAAVTVLALSIVPYVRSILSAMKEFSSYSNAGHKYIVPIMKITGIAYVSQIGAKLCEDSGEKALASGVETAGKIFIAVATLPIAKEAFIKIMGILT